MEAVRGDVRSAGGYPIRATWASLFPVITSEIAVVPAPRRDTCVGTARTMRSCLLACFVMLAIAAMGCDEEAIADASVTVDAGTDGGPGDAGTDAGPTPTFRIRLINDIPGLVGTTDEVGAAHVCAWFSNEGTVVGPPQFLTQATGPVPFRGVSPYLEFPVVAPIDYLLGLYDPGDLGTPAACPNDPHEGGAPAAAVLAEIAPELVPEGSFVSVVATGLAPDTLGATGGALPSVCNPAGAPTFMEPCTTFAQLVVYEDDRTPPASGMTRFRVMNQVANSTPPSGWTLCYDPGVVPMTPPAMGCTDLTPGARDNVALASAVAYGDATEYQDRAPIVPTGSPIAGIGGGLYLHLEDGSGCPPLIAGQACFPILAAFPPPAAGDDALPDEVRPMMEDGAILTVFINGLLPPGAPFEPDFGVSFFVWQDNLVAAP